MVHIKVWCLKAAFEKKDTFGFYQKVLFTAYATQVVQFGCSNVASSACVLFCNRKMHEVHPFWDVKNTLHAFCDN